MDLKSNCRPTRQAEDWQRARQKSLRSTWGARSKLTCHGDETMKRRIFPAMLITWAALGTAHAQDIIATSTTDWRGFYAGGNIGGAWNHTCNSWEPGPLIRGNPALADAFYNRNCPNNGNFIGGVDLGYNFQFEQW